MAHHKTMAITASSVNSYVEAAITAIEASDWATARRKLLAAKAALVALPDAAKSGETLEWDRGAIDELIRQVNDEERRQSPSRNTLGFTKIEHKEVGA